MIYIIITTSIFSECEIRKNKYIKCINNLNNIIKENNIDCYIIIVENNGLRQTYLDNLNCKVYYTNNNININTGNKGHKELQDIIDCIQYFKIQDNDFIVKMTGRYFLHKDSNFIYELKNNVTKYDAIIRYGSCFFNPKNIKRNNDDCCSGLIGMTCHYIKLIKPISETHPIEKDWAKITHLMNKNRICHLHYLGIDICPLNKKYYSI